MDETTRQTPVPMRRNDRAVTDEAEIAAILDACKVCNLAFSTGGAPYVVPLSFGYALERGVLKLYFHSAKEGRKLALLSGDPRVGFAVSRMTGDVCADAPCRSGCYYESVIGAGVAKILTDPGEACAALGMLMRHQFGRDVKFTPAQAAGVCVFCVVSESFQGKRKANPNAQ